MCLPDGETAALKSQRSGDGVGGQVVADDSDFFFGVVADDPRPLVAVDRRAAVARDHVCGGWEDLLDPFGEVDEDTGFVGDGVGLEELQSAR